MDWTKGYVADIGYTAGFYRETAPAHMAFAALTLGRSPGRALKPRRMLEVGFGQGLGLALLAAANPDTAFEGYDFNPEHVAHARRLIDEAGLTNVTATETSFEEAAARGGDNDLDVIALHGIFSWVARASQDAIVSILRQRLQPNGVAYVSYNCMPGWAPLAPIRQLMVQVKRNNPGRSERQLALALDLMGKLRTGNAGYFAANPTAAQHFDSMLGMDRVYLAHEYLDEHWDLFQFSEMAARMGEAKLSFLASATLLENLDQYAVQPALQPALAEVSDPVLRETVRDYAGNKRFRRDVFARGSAALTSAEHRRLLAQMSFALIIPRKFVTFEFAGPLDKLVGHAEIHTPVVDLLAQKNASFDELLALPAFGEERITSLLDCLACLVHSGQVQPVFTPDIDPAPAHRFNRMIVGHARAGRIYGALASPVTGSGIPVGDFGVLTLAAIYDGKADDAASVARHAMSMLKIMGRRPTKQGRSLDDDGEATIFLAENMQPILQDSVPVWDATGASAISIGTLSNAAGASGVAVGTQSAANGVNSTSIGFNTGTGGAVDGATAVGANAGLTGQGTNSTAIGINTAAAGVNSFAGGNGSSASGKSGIALGDGATAGPNANAIAIGTGAKSTGSVAIGAASSATGGNTAVGDGAKADTAAGASAFGQGTNASGANSVAVGINSGSAGANSVSIGNNALANGAGQISIGNVAGPGAAVAGATSIGSGSNTGGAGINSTALGINTSSTGASALALGNAASANFANSAAIGNGAAATKANEMAFGTATNTYTAAGITSAASTAAQTGVLSMVTTDATGHLGSAGIAGGVCLEPAGGNFQCGTGATATAGNGTAVGQGAQATANGASAYGKSANAGGVDATAVGINATATGAFSTAVGSGSGLQAKALGSFSVALGNGTVANASGSVAIGSTTPGVATANAVDSLAMMGATTTAGADRSLAIGLGAATGAAATEGIAFGTGASATSVSGVAMGNGAAATGGKNSTAIGVNSKASASGANAFGAGAKATGTDAVAIGSLSTASAAGAVAIGLTSSATGTNAIAIGTNAVATGSVAIGSGASAGNGGAAFGDNSVATGTNSTATGNGAKATFANSTAIGTGATTTAANQIVVGTATNTYTMPGLASAASLSAQTGTTKFLSSDAAGNVAASNFGPTDIGGLQSNVAVLQSQMKQAFEGTAMAIAMGGSALPGDKKFAISTNWGTFRGEHAGAVLAQARVTENIVLNGGVAFGFQQGGVGGRLGATFAW